MIDLEVRAFTKDEFRTWLNEAGRGDVCVYHTGFIARDRYPGYHKPTEEQKERAAKIEAIGYTAMKAAGYSRHFSTKHETAVWNFDPAQARVDLVQRRIGKGQFEYLAVAR